MSASALVKLKKKNDEEHPGGRPTVRSECPTGPCPWVSCRYHLLLDVVNPDTGLVRKGFDTLEEMEETCALNAAEDGARKLQEVRKLMGVSKVRVKAVNESALKKMKMSCENE